MPHSVALLNGVGGIGSPRSAIAALDTRWKMMVEARARLSVQCLCPRTQEDHMSTVTTNDGATIFYKDWAPKNAQPIVFHHGWPLSADDWDNQMLYFLAKGYRVVAHDRRGHGRSSQVSDGHDMDHY